MNIEKLTQNGLINLTDLREVTLTDLAIPHNLNNLVAVIKSLNPRKQKVGIADFQVFLPPGCIDQDVVEHITKAILTAEDDVASELWEQCTAELKYEMIIPDGDVLNIDIVRKVNIEGDTIRNAFLSLRRITPPEQTPYAYTYGSTTVEEAAALVSVLKQIQKMKPEGQMNIQEFFEEVDLRIFYLFAMHEAEYYAEYDPDGGAYLQLAMETGDKIPEGVVLLSWLQSYVPEKFDELRESLMDPIWQENRSLFWKGWIRQNNPAVNEDFYESRHQYSRPIIGDIDDESILDDLIRRNEAD